MKILSFLSSMISFFRSLYKISSLLMPILSYLKQYQQNEKMLEDATALSTNSQLLTNHISIEVLIVIPNITIIK